MVDLVVRKPRNPMRLSRSGCCARAARGHATAAPPSSVMNWRRFTTGMDSLRSRRPSSGRSAQAVFRTISLPQAGRQVLGANLNCSEISAVSPAR
jgi:hypothetical protein